MDTTSRKTLVQCDFDGTVTIEDASFMILEFFADGNWEEVNRKYQAGEITVGRFNSEAFGMVRGDKETLLRAIKGKVEVRPGFPEMVDYCRRKGLRLVIVSNGLDFYIDEVLGRVGLGDIPVFAARTEFNGNGLSVEYIGPDGRVLDEAFKEAYVDLFLNEGYRVIYAGNGDSDFLPAKKCHHIFATGSLLDRCQRARVDCVPFSDFREIIRELERIP